MERLLLETARHAPAEPRLFIMAATWLARYEKLIARDWLTGLIQRELESEHSATMGMLLDTARDAAGTHHLSRAINQCRPSDDSMPLFEIERRNATLRALARRKASEMSRRWGRWTQPIELKFDALRPAHWVIANNGEAFRLRADLRGDLRLSVLLALRDNPDAGSSEMALARECCAQRPSMRDALNALSLAGRVQISRPAANRKVISLVS